MNTLNSGRFNSIPSSMYKSYSRISQSKSMHISPVHKGGDPSEISNYRPISILSNLDKAFERLIFKYVYNHFLENNILTSFQSGLRRGDSTVNQLSWI